MDYSKITDDQIEDAIKASRNDLFAASRMVHMPYGKFEDRVTRTERLRDAVIQVGEVRRDDDYETLTAKQFNDRYETLARRYRMEGLEVIHELATMEFDDSAAMADVKLKAAIKLRDIQVDNQVMDGQLAILAELNSSYQQNAPRIKSIRVAQIEFQEK